MDKLFRESDEMDKCYYNLEKFNDSKFEKPNNK